MKKNRFIIISVLLIVTSVALCACNADKTVKKFVGYMNSSVNEVKSVKSEIEVKDGDTFLYGYTRNMTIQGTEADVETTETKLNSSFELSSSTDVAHVNDVDRKTLIPVSISLSGITAVTTVKTGFSCEITPDNFASVLKLGYYGSIDGNAKLDCVFSGKKLTSVRCGYTTTSGKNVSVLYTYSY